MFDHLMTDYLQTHRILPPHSCSLALSHWLRCFHRYPKRQTSWQVFRRRQIAHLDPSRPDLTAYSAYLPVVAHNARKRSTTNYGCVSRQSVMRAHKMYVNISHAWFINYGLSGNAPVQHQRHSNMHGGKVRGSGVSREAETAPLCAVKALRTD